MINKLICWMRGHKHMMPVGSGIYCTSHCLRCGKEEQPARYNFSDDEWRWFVRELDRLLPSPTTKESEEG